MYLMSSKGSEFNSERFATCYKNHSSITPFIICVYQCPMNIIIQAYLILFTTIYQSRDMDPSFSIIVILYI